MKAAFVIAEGIGDGETPQTALRPWFSGLVNGWSGTSVGNSHAGNIFAEDQAVIDAIDADPRTVFSIPIDVDGLALDYSNEIEVHPSIQGKIIAWCAQTYGVEFGNRVSQNAKNRHFVAQEIMRRTSGLPTADPLEGFRIYWE